MIYLDANSTIPLSPYAFLSMFNISKSVIGNPSSAHQGGRLSRFILEKSRVKISKYLGCLPSEFIFTSGGTESNNMVLKGFPGRCVVISAYVGFCTPDIMNKN